MSMFAKFYQTKNVCYDSDYEENDFQPPDEDDEPDTLDESVPSQCLFTTPKDITDSFYESQVAMYNTLTPNELCEEYFSVKMALSELSKDVDETKIKSSKEYQRLKLYLENKGVYHNTWTGQIEFKIPIKTEEKPIKKKVVKVDTGYVPLDVNKYTAEIIKKMSESRYFKLTDSFTLADNLRFSAIETGKYDKDYDYDKRALNIQADIEANQFIKLKKVVSKTEKKPTKKLPKDGKFDICGYTGKLPKACDCVSCSTKLCSGLYEEKWLATKLEVKFADKEFVKSKGAFWSQTEKCWYVKLSNPNYTELVETY